MRRSAALRSGRWCWSATGLVDLDFRVAEQVGDGERVAYALFHEHVAVGAGDADEFDFRAAQRVGDGERVVDAGIEIKNELLHDCAFLVD